MRITKSSLRYLLLTASTLTMMNQRSLAFVTRTLVSPTNKQRILFQPLHSAPTATSETEKETSKGPLEDKDAYSKVSMDDIVSLCKRRGFIFASSDIYNGMAGFYDYGPLGSELKKNIKDIWWREFVTRRENIVGIDSSIIHNPATWKSSGMCIHGIFIMIHII